MKKEIQQMLEDMVERVRYYDSEGISHHLHLAPQSYIDNKRAIEKKLAEKAKARKEKKAKKPIKSLNSRLDWLLCKPIEV